LGSLEARQNNPDSFTANRVKRSIDGRNYIRLEEESAEPVLPPNSNNAKAKVASAKAETHRKAKGDRSNIILNSSENQKKDVKTWKLLEKRSARNNGRRSTFRLTSLLTNTGLRKRLSKMLLNGELGGHYPQYVGR